MEWWTEMAEGRNLIKVKSIDKAWLDEEKRRLGITRVELVHRMRQVMQNEKYIRAKVAKKHSGKSYNDLFGGGFL